MSHRAPVIPLRRPTIPPPPRAATTESILIARLSADNARLAVKCERERRRRQAWQTVTLLLLALVTTVGAMVEVVR